MRIRSMSKPTVLFACAALGVLTASATNTSAQDPVPDALQRARQAVGGKALLNVKGLSLDEQPRLPLKAGEATPGLDIMLPDRCRARTITIAHILAGDKFWQSKDTDSGVRQRARQRIEFDCARVAIVYLLAVPRFLNVTVTQGASRTLEGVGKVDVLTYSGDRGFTLDLFLQNDMPVAYSWPFATSPPSGPHLAFLRDYREIAGVKFPFHLEGTAGPYKLNTTMAAITVNPPDLDKAFIQP
jgi:hypothetical protein